MNINIDKNSQIPIYFQIQKQIRNMIEDISLKPGDQLPTERKLSSDLGISRVTIRKAMRGLITEGLCEKKSGKGIFVAAEKMLMNIKTLQGTTAFIRQLGYEINTKVLKKEILEVSEKIRSKLEMVNSDKVLFLQRVRYVNKEPVILDETYLPLYLYKNIEEKEFDRSLYNILDENYNIEPFYSKGKYNIRVSGEEESEILNLKLNTPLLVKKAIAYTEEETPLEHNITKYRTDKFEFIFESKYE